MAMFYYRQLFSLRISFTGLQKYFFYDDDLPQMIVGVFDNSVNIPVIIPVFFVRKVFPGLTLRQLFNPDGKVFGISQGLVQ
jgi:hypothetical protein